MSATIYSLAPVAVSVLCPAMFILSVTSRCRLLSFQ